MKPTLYSKKLKEDNAKCLICDSCCEIKHSQKGACSAYQNIKGRLYSLLYGLISQRRTNKETKELLISSLGDTDPTLNRFSKKISNCLTNPSVKIPALLECYPFELLRICKTEGLERIVFTGSDPACCIDFIVDIAKEAKRKKVLVVVKNTDRLSEVVRKRIKHLSLNNLFI